ncbi:hypothetical protein GPECTOR_83g301 [Gonium pectorale]|uniref:Ion transport domain-containing protein n=1 Tax=Gonium pectorale TaxID=33097 RepID=A0A150G1D8_GONPE|nr:hypothetical protein GPECTOR_83g301 [Gonium pectorale]|eukprot:KXZ43689.1 hypothetical protein GPECTOR_83g301 [Gonium pectorale]
MALMPDGKDTEPGAEVVCLDEEQAAGVTEVESSPGLKQFGIQSLTLHKDARADLVVTVEPSRVFDLSARDISEFRLWDDPHHFCRPGQRLPEQLRRGPTYAFTAVNDHWEATRADYLQVSFFQPCQVYLLMISTGRVPLWVRDLFNKVPESKCALAVDWQLAPHVVVGGGAAGRQGPELLAMMSQKLPAVRNAKLHLWEAKQPCVPGQLYKFGGSEGVQGLDDYTYIFVWRPLGPDELAALEAGAGPAGMQGQAWDAEGPEGPEAGEATAQGRAANVRRRAGYLERMVQAVLDDDIENLQRACRAYQRLVGPTAATTHGSSSGAAAPPGGGEVAVPRPPSHAVAPVRPSFLTASGRPLTSVAAALNVQPRLVLYLVTQGAEVDSTALRFILNNAKALPTGGYRDVRHFMMSYVMHQRNPITTAMVFAQFLDEFAEANSGKAHQYSDLAKTFRSLSVELVELLDKLAVTPGEDEVAAAQAAAEGGEEAGGDAVVGPPATLADILAPQGVVCSINDYSPLQVAYETKDLEFMSASVVQGYLQDRWLGSGYIANCLVDKGEMIHFGDHRLVVKVMESAGFVGSVGRKLMKYLSYTMHIVLLAARPFFDSPRGRWAFRLMCEGFFLYCFHAVQLMRDQESIRWQHPMLVLYVASMVVDELQEVLHQYHGRLAVYFADGFNVIEAVAMVLLVGSGACKAAMLGVGVDNPRWPDLRTAKDFLFNTASIFVWARLLQYIIPLYDGVGSLLMVISNMIKEVFKFAVPGVILLMGVSFTIYSTFRDRAVPQLESLPSVVLLLFRTFLGETMFEVLQDEDNTLYNLYGNIIVLLYALTATVVLANLLIALITYHFKPEKVESQSRFQMAEILAHYEYMVEHQLIGAPFSLPQLLLTSLLPSGWRSMAPASTLHRMALMPIDGNPVSNESRDSKLYPTGSREVPYMFFLLTAYPLLLGVCWVLCLLMAPYCILFFALYGYRRWVPQPDPPSDGAAATADGGSFRGGSKVAPEAAPAPAPAPESRPHQPAFGAGVFATMQGTDSEEEGERGATHRISLVEIRGSAAVVLKRGKGEESASLDPAHWVPADGMYPEWDTKQRLTALASLTLRVLLYTLFRPLWIGLGAAVYLGGLGLLVATAWLGIYTWGGRLAYTGYWILHGWCTGWFGSSRAREPRSSASQITHSQSQSQQRRSSGKGPVGAAARRATWVRIQQAALKDGGQVLQEEEIVGAMLRAGIPKAEVDAAVTGAWAYAPAGAGAGGSGGRVTGTPTEGKARGDANDRAARKERRRQRKQRRREQAAAARAAHAGGLDGERPRGSSPQSGRWTREGTSSSSSASSSDFSSSDEERAAGASRGGVRAAAEMPRRLSPPAALQAQGQAAGQGQGAALPEGPARLLLGLLNRVQGLEADLRATLEKAAVM